MAIIKTMKNGDGAQVFPVTSASAVYMKGGVVSVQTVLDDMKQNGSVIEFRDDGSVKTTLPSGNIIHTKYLQNGNIVETTTDSNGTTLCVKTIEFNEDGTITTTVTYSEGGAYV